MPVEISLEMKLVLFMIAAFVCCSLFVYRIRAHNRIRHKNEVECMITFCDRRKTLPLIEACFEEAKIREIDLHRDIRRREDEEIFINTYRLYVPRYADLNAVVSRLSAVGTVQSVRIRQM